MKKYRFRLRESDLPQSLFSYLKLKTSLEEHLIKDACEKGACFYQAKGKGKTIRQRADLQRLSTDDHIIFNYDSKVLSLPWVHSAECLLETKNFGIWLKDVNVLTQGSEFSDHSSLLSYLERTHGSEVFLIHRLDRETLGPVIFGYNKRAAHLLSDLFQKQKIQKTYHAIVKGHLQIGEKKICEEKLDGKEARTEIECIDVSGQCSELIVKIESGRLHQIRRHLELMGCPIVGDPKYGRGNKSKIGLQLECISLEFIEPFQNKPIKIDLVPRFTLSKIDSL